MGINHLTHKSQEAVQSIVSAINHRMISRTNPLVVSLDGGSGAGKSTLAAEVASHLGATVIQCDDFFAATITDDEWDTYTTEQKCRLCIDWQRMRTEALLPLLAGENAQYCPFSFSSSNGLASNLVVKEPSEVIILDGIYSSLLELTDVVHFTILVDVLPNVRRHRHNLREGNEDVAWHRRWDPAEDYYFSVLRPRTSFDLIVNNQ
ncbi:(d)CMP kinase [Paenibacillus sp. N3/727]|uniref:uridine kinase family protein n=1 Tax=Paenibacillus sp. N3/727 TaxID=2925845 RepID=UPI001F5366B5|nr:(d)CMP kinase [Paenibacillus sp. N3/727]UNK16332.1 (d)CMP kinase [Paenibacillus sp. N3/727]